MGRAENTIRKAPALVVGAVALLMAAATVWAFYSGNQLFGFLGIFVTTWTTIQAIEIAIPSPPKAQKKTLRNPFSDR